MTMNLQYGPTAVALALRSFDSSIGTIIKKNRQEFSKFNNSLKSGDVLQSGMSNKNNR